MKKKIFLLLTVLFCLCAALALTACGGDTPDHTHTYGEWVETTAPTCTTRGIKTHVCDCGHSETQYVDKTAHTPAAWSSDATNHWRDCTACGYDVDPIAAHTYDAENTCACGDCKGVQFTLSNGTYEVSDYTGTATEVVIPSTYKGVAVTSIGSSAFEDCSQLTTITIPDSVTSIGSSAFWDCFNLATVTFGANSKLTSIGDGAFRTCDSLTTITIPAGVTSIGINPFVGCDKLTTLLVQSGNTAYYMSGNCLIERESKALITGFANSVIPTDGSVTSIGSYAFTWRSQLTTITIPDGVTSIGYGAFYDCSKLTTVEFGANSKLTSIGDEAFYDCDGLTSITIPAGVTSIGSSAFEGCANLTTVEFGANSKLTSIGYRVFSDCSNLTTITIPAGVTSIGEYAFSYCDRLTTVYYGGSASDWENITIGSYNSKLTSATRYYYSATEPTEAGNWWYYDQNGKPAVWGK